MTQTLCAATFRRITPAIAASARLAMTEALPDVTKGEMAILLKKAAPALGIDGTAYHVLDILLGLTRADDWHGNGRPVVAISNAKLAEYTMRSERTVIRCLRKLVEAGIAAYRDSSTGRRFVQRNDRGVMIAGFGIDFTPARARFTELSALVSAYQKQLQEKLAAKRDIARLSRAIRDLYDAFPSLCDAGHDPQLDHSEEQIDISAQADRYRAIHAHLLERLELQPLMSAEGDIHVMPITDTNLEICSEGSEQTQGVSRDRTVVVERMALDEDNVRCETARSVQDVQAEVLRSVPIELLSSACSEAQMLAGISLRSWTDLRANSGALRVLVGIREASWIAGCTKVGPFASAAILATVVEKAARDPDVILKPEAYFLAMIDRAVEGRLNLQKSLYGLASSGIAAAA